VAKKDGTIFRSVSDKEDFTVLVNLALDNEDLRFYVVPTSIVDVWLQADGICYGSEQLQKSSARLRAIPLHALPGPR
jgi:hypothetical protein